MIRSSLLRSLVPYLNRRYQKVLKIGLLLCLFSLGILIYYANQPDVAVERFPPQTLPSYKCPFSLGSDEKRGEREEKEAKLSNLTDHRLLVLLESTSSRHGKLIIQVLNAKRIPYKAETLSKNLPMLTTSERGRYSMIVIENYYKYLNMAKWNKQMLNRYCSEYKVPLLGFLTSRANDSFERARIKGTSLYLWQNQTITALRVEESKIHRIAKEGAERLDLVQANWVLFEQSSDWETLLSAVDVSGRRRGAVVVDGGKTDGVEKIIFGHNITDWTVKMTFLDTLWHFSGVSTNWTLNRYIQVDIDDIFVGARGTRMVESDVLSLIESQKRLRQEIHNFTYTLGFSGSYFRNGDDMEDRGDELLIEHASKFIWFPHMWRHNHAHEHNGTYLLATMAQNKLFAQSMRIPVAYRYAIAPQHDGVYPIHEEMYSAWKEVWNVEVTATEEYPHFKPPSSRRGFVYRNISVLPRQTCGLYTHTQFFHSYPDGLNKLVSLIEGGDLFSTILLNPISIFMTHQQNFAHDRLAIYTFENLIRFIHCWTNLKLKWQDPISSAKMYFDLYPQERNPIWNNPCTDPRHRVIVPPSINCTTITVPNLIIAGPQKTGTTALTSFLSLHPNVSTNDPIPGSFEELQFFGAANYNKGLEWYINKFKPASVVVEKSANYFDNPEAAKQIYSLMPDANIVVILYDPSKRAYSWYHHLLAHNDTVAQSATNFSEILTSQTVPYKKIRQRCISGGRYTHHLDRWLEYFPLSQIHLIDGQVLKDNPVKIMTELSAKIGLPAFDYKSAIRFSPSKGFFCQLISGKTKCLGASKGRSYPPVSPEIQKQLDDTFRQDNIALQRFLSKNKLKTPIWLSRALEL